MLSLLVLITDTGSFRSLAQDFKSGNFSHAYMFTCQDALFLKHFLKFAAAVAVCPNCGCFECISCRKTIHDNHADVLTYPREKDVILKAEISEITENCFVLPVESGIKVYVLNNFSKTAAQMQNKLLKTLEEPPDNTVFFLGVTNEGTVLDTIKSRCRKIALDEVDFNSVVKYLCEKGIPESDALIAAAVSFSQPLTAESYAGSKSFFSMFEDTLNVISYLNNSREALNAVSRLAAYREHFTELLNIMLVIFREALILSGKPELLLLINRKNDIMKITEKFSVTALIKSVEYVNRAKAELEAKCSFNAVLDNLILSILEVKFRCPK